MLPDSAQFVPQVGASRTLRGEEHAPIRYVFVANWSTAGATVTVYGGEAAAGEVLAQIPPKLALGFPIGERDAVTVAVSAGAPAPLPGDQVVFSADTAHLAAVAAILSGGSANASVGTVGAAAPASATMVAIDNAGVLKAWGADTTGIPQVSLTQLGQGIYAGDQVDETNYVMRLYTNAANVGITATGGGGTWSTRRFSNGTAHLLPATALVAATTSAIWTPASGLRFRLLGGLISVNAAAATSVKLMDGTMQVGPDIQVAVGASTIPYPSPPQGTLSAAANNVLGIQSPGTPTVSVVAWGMEE